MGKRFISEKQYDFLKSEMNYFKKQEVISGEQENSILDSYEVKKRLSFVSVILVIGAVLVGLGILSFIASNWKYISPLAKFAVIFIFYIAINIGSFYINVNYPKTSRSLHYLGSILFGAGIFLIGQAFNLGGDFKEAFLYWALGILPAVVLFKDKLLFIFTQILFGIYLNGHFMRNEFPYLMFLIIPGLYYLNTHFNYSKAVTFINNILVLNLAGYFAYRYEMNVTYVVLMYFALGLLMFYIPFKFNKDIFKLEGSLVFGIAGIILTFKYVWAEMFYGFGHYYNRYYDYARYTRYLDNANVISIIFSILFVIYLLYLIKRNNFLALIFTCIIIFRFYVDTLFDFMPKSILFLSSGILLIGLGFFVERTRRKMGGTKYVEL